MFTTQQCTAGIILAATSLAFQPVTVGAGVNWPAVDPDNNAAYENFSGTHPSATPKTTEGMRGSEGPKGEAGMAGAKTAVPDVNQAFEDYSGTHPTPADTAKTTQKKPQGHGR
jgi:hypothetical protein